MMVRRIPAAAALAAAVILGLAAAPARAERATLDHAGRTLTGDLVRSPGTRLADGVVLLVPGGRGHADGRLMTGLQDQLKARGFNSLAVTPLPGREGQAGRRGCDGVHRHTHWQTVDAVGAWVAWLRERGARRITLLGDGRAAAQVTWYALRGGKAADAVARLILLSPMTWQFDGAAKRYRERYGSRLGPLLARARRRVGAGKGDSVLDGVGFLGCDAARVTARAFLSYYGADPRKDTPTLLADIDRPTLIVRGLRAPDSGRRMARLPDDGPGSPFTVKTLRPRHGFGPGLLRGLGRTIELFLIR